MGKVYILAGTLAVFTVAGLSWLLIARFGWALFRPRSKKEKDE